MVGRNGEFVPSYEQVPSGNTHTLEPALRRVSICLTVVTAVSPLRRTIGSKKNRRSFEPKPFCIRCSLATMYICCLKDVQISSGSTAVT